MKKQSKNARSAATSSKPELRLDWCSHEAAKYAVEKWHYSRRMPNSKLVKIGVWEGGDFVGVVIFGVGATPEIAKPFGLNAEDVCELVRVALSRHVTPVSRIVAIALRMLRGQCPKTKMVVSFADSAQGHHGGIYQAGGWVFIGTKAYHAYRVLGEMVHPRTLYDRYGVGGQSIPWLRKNVDPKAQRVITGAKHKYAMAFTDELRAKLNAKSLPYPKRAASESGDTSANHAEKGGSIPTAALSKKSVTGKKAKRITAEGKPPRRGRT
jgi:hypothetical protein